MATTLEDERRRNIASGQVQVIRLNQMKRGADNKYHRLEIPVALAKPIQSLSASQFCCVSIDPLALNSNCQLELSYAFGSTQVIAAL